MSYVETRSPSLKADDHEILVRLMLSFCGFLVLIRKTTMMSAARCGLDTEVSSSLCPCRAQYSCNRVKYVTLASLPVAYSRKQTPEMVRGAKSW